MSRYSLRLRPKYGENELTGPEQLSQGIGKFLGDYTARKDVERQERNTIGQAGGTILPDDPANSIQGRWDRLKQGAGRVAHGIGALLGHGETPPGSDLGTTVSGTAKDGVMPTYTDVMGGLTRRTPNVSGMAGIMPGEWGAYGQPGRPRPGTGWDERIPTEYDMTDGAGVGVSPDVAAANQQPHPAPPVASPPMIPPGARTPNGPSIGAMLGGAGGAGGFDPGETYTYEGRGGLRATMPNAIGQARLSARAKLAEQAAQDEPKIQALIDAGMDPKEARARVLNNVVRYDETFGQQHAAGRGGSGMTQEDRLQIQDRLDARAKRAQEVQLLLAQQRNMGADQRAKLNAELRRLSIESSADQALLRGAQSELNTTTSQLSKMNADPVATNTPAGRQAIGALQQRADSLGKVVQGAQGRVATKATPVPPAPAAPPPVQKRTITQAQYDAAIAKGATDAQIAAAYNIDPRVKRKRQ